MPSYRMRVHKYIPSRLYGFVIDQAGRQVFFHLGAFDPKGSNAAPVRPCGSCTASECMSLSPPVPPTLGEEVEVFMEEPLPEGVEPEKAPKALRVVRSNPPLSVTGTVDSFDHARGYGFIAGDDGVSYHLHRSEVLDGRMPFQHQRVAFYAGSRRGKPRACHVRLCLKRN